MPEQEINAIKEKIKKEGEELVLKGFPRKILDLNKLSNSDKFLLTSSLKPFELNVPIPTKLEPKAAEVAKEDKSKKSKDTVDGEKGFYVEDDDFVISKPLLFPNGKIECNQQFIEMIEELKPRLIQLTEDIFHLKLAVNLMVPKIEDGNNFGVEIQRETIDTIQSVESQVLSHFDKFETYFEARGDIIAKVVKYPHNQDYRIALKETDQRFHSTLCLTLTDVRNHYLSLHDLVTKNLNRIKKPKSGDNTEFLY